MVNPEDAETILDLSDAAVGKAYKSWLVDNVCKLVAIATALQETDDVLNGRMET